MKKRSTIISAAALFFVANIANAATTAVATLDYQAGAAEIDQIIHYGRLMIEAVSPIIWLIFGVYIAIMIIRHLVSIAWGEKAEKSAGAPTNYRVPENGVPGYYGKYGNVDPPGRVSNDVVNQGFEPLSSSQARNVIERSKEMEDEIFNDQN